MFNVFIKPAILHCGRCHCEITAGKEESCWFCFVPLCSKCWDEFGHCGHPEAVEIEEKNKEQNS